MLRRMLLLCLVLVSLFAMSCGSIFSSPTTNTYSLCQDVQALNSGYLVSYQCQALSWNLEVFPIVLHLDQNLPTSFFTAFDQIAQEWNGILGFEVFKLDIGLQSNNNIRLLSALEWQQTGGDPKQQARTIYKYTGNRFLAVDILFSDAFNYALGPVNHGVDLFTLVRHELGHVLGLGHTADGLMQKVLPNNVSRSIANSDIQKVDNLYNI